jgi:hypothetical protein
MYYADIIERNVQGCSGLVARRLYNNVTSLKKAITQSLIDKPRDVAEVVVMRYYETKRDKIHGYYSWDGEALKLDQSKPVLINNILYGRA